MAHQLIRDLGGVAGREEHVLAAAASPGELVETADGRVGLVCGHRDFASGETVSIITNAIVDVDSASGTTFSAKATANFNTSTKLAVGTGSGIGLGTVMIAKTSGQLKVRVRINGIKVTPV